MIGIPRWLVGSIGKLAGATALIVCAMGGRLAQGQENSAKPVIPPASAVAAQQSFESPEVLARHFATELARLANRQEVISPAELGKELEAKGSCAIDTAPEPTEKLSPELVYARARKSVVVLGALAPGKKRGGGKVYCATGFLIRQDGVMVTNLHVLMAFQEMKAIGAMLDDGRVFPITAVLAADRHNDIAVLKLQAENLTPLPLATDVPVGATVFCISHPALNCQETENGFFTFTQGIVSGKFRLRLRGGAPLNVLTITADYTKGSSGGPILNEHGAVVGMVCETLPIHHDEYERDVQMVWKFSRPSSSILALLR